MRRHAGGRRCGPRAAASQAPPGRPGSPPAGTTAGCLQWLDEDGRRVGESRPDQWASRPVRARKCGSRKPVSTAATPSGAKAAMERREAPAFPATEARQDGRLVRRSALHPLGFARGRQGRTASPGPQRTRAMTLGCLTIESESRGRIIRAAARLSAAAGRDQIACERRISFELRLLTHAVGVVQRDEHQNRNGVEVGLAAKGAAVG
jgi:hypothetical protein